MDMNLRSCTMLLHHDQQNFEPTHCGKAGNLISEPLGLYDSNFLCHTLVCMEVKCQPVVILLNNHPGSLLDGLGSDATLQDGLKSSGFVKLKISKQNGQHYLTICAQQSSLPASTCLRCSRLGRRYTPPARVLRPDGQSRTHQITEQADVRHPLKSVGGLASLAASGVMPCDWDCQVACRLPAGRPVLSNSRAKAWQKQQKMHHGVESEHA